MTELIAYLSGVGVLGPGLADWPGTEAILAGREPYVRADTVLPPPDVLAPTERRRAGRVVRLALAVGLEAVRRSASSAAQLPVVFASSGGDGDNCDAICQTLASPNRALSPTRFHNSVHNAPAGYWSIAAGARVATTTVCCYDASFAAGLLEALAQCATTGTETALIAYDLDYPPPLHAVRPTPAPFGVALVLRPAADGRAFARLRAQLVAGTPGLPAHGALAALAGANPAARSLVLLEALARGRPAAVNLQYLEPATLRIEVDPCR